MKDLDGSTDGKQVLTTYSNLFNGEYATLKPVSNKVILVQGEAGMGKTMLCLSILEDWAGEKLFQEFQIIIFLPLRNVASASTLSELLNMLYPDFNSDTRTKLATYLEKNNKYSVLIIADGWEDLQLSQRQKESFFHSLLFSKDIIPTSSVTVLITTASPSYIHAQTQLKLIDRFITLAGFDRMVVESVIQSEFKGDIKKIAYLIGQLNENPIIARTCSTPLKLAVLCDLCQSNDNTKPLPNTMTELYSKLVWTLAAKSIGYRNIFKYDDLPIKLRKPWQLLCEMAFKNIEKGHDTYSQSDALKFAMCDLEVVSYFGLIKPISESGNTLHVSFSFLHPYFEQYLASLHLALQPHEAQLTLMEDLPVGVECDTEAVSMFWYFFLSNYVRTIPIANVNPEIVVQVLKKISTANHSTKRCYFNDICRLSFEVKNSIVNHQVLKTMNVIDKDHVLKFGHCHGVYDCIAMIYVIENIMQECEVEIGFQDCCLNSYHINSLASALGNKSSIVHVRGLNLSCNKLNNSLAVDFFNRAAAAFKWLRILILRNCEIGTESDIQAILCALKESSCETLIHLDLSFNPISISFLQTLQSHIQDSNTFNALQNLSLKGSFESDVTARSLSTFGITLSSRCKYLRRLDLSDNNLGEPGNTALSTMISQLLSLGRDFHLCLSEEYMSEVNDEFICIMEQTIKKKGTINHTIAHGIIVGPGRSGKNTLMSRLMGNGPPERCSSSPSTGVLENIIKVEVKKLSTVATAVSNLEWKKLKYDEEALELIMTTARQHSDTAKPSALKYILEKDRENHNKDAKSLQTTSPPKYIEKRRKKNKLSISFTFFKNLRKLKGRRSKRNKESVAKHKEEEKSVVVYRPDIEPVDIFKRAVELRGMDALREHLESSWSLYLTNTGGQIEFQEYLPFLVCGPSIFFVTFPLHHDLEKHYDVCYEYPDGKVKEYKSPATLLEELLQILATINASNFSSGEQRNSNAAIKPKIFFVGTHKDCLSADSAEESIQKQDKLLQDYVRQTSLFHQGSIQFAQPEDPKQLIFTVDNLSNDGEQFEKIRLAVQQTVKKNDVVFTIECPSSWLTLSLILRAKYISDKVLSFEKCYSIAKECGITNHTELKQALSFIHSRLGLIRYFNTDDLNTLVVIDPQILFDRITDLIVKTFTSDKVEINQIEDFRLKGIIPLAVMQEISDKEHSESQLPFMWLTKLLNYLRIAALFTDTEGDKYFFPSALCHAPEAHSSQSSSNSQPPLLVGFESGFCPRGIPGALIKYLMTNEMKSAISWDIISNKIFKNQVSFAIQAHQIITLKILPTHLEISCESEEEIDLHSEVDSTEMDLTQKTCEIAFEQIWKGMIAVTSQCRECKFFFGFYCTLTACKAQHLAQIQWSGMNPVMLVCKVSNKRGNLPRGSNIWNLRRNLYPGKRQLGKEIDACNNEVLKHLGQIADSMTEWEGRISEELQLTPADVACILTQHPNKLKLQTRAALHLWKERLGSHATYEKLINIFESAGYQAYAEFVRNIACSIEGEIDDFVDPGSELLPQPETYPPTTQSPPSSHKLSSRTLSSYDEYLLINPAAAQNLPKDDIYSHNMLDSCNDVSIVPSLSSKEPRIKPVAPAPSPRSESIENHKWFFGKTTFSQSSEWLMLPYNQHGSYLIRYSESNPGQYVLSLRNDEIVNHYRIQQLQDGRFFIDGNDGVNSFRTILELVTYYQLQADGLPVKLIHPCIKCAAADQAEDTWEIDRKQLNLTIKLGEGEFSDVWEGLLHNTKYGKVSVKIRKPQMISQPNFLQMASLMKNLHHPRLVNLVAVCTKEEPIYIITEPIEYGTLLKYLRSEKGRSTMTLPQVATMSAQIAEGMAYLEGLNVIHRDLAARNILLGESLNCKVTNFELARMVDQDIFEANNEIRVATKWTAPEAASQNRYSIKSDIWSFGIVLYEMITWGCSPYLDMSDADVLENLKHGYRMPQPDKCPQWLYNIMLDCWRQKPEKRPTFKALQLSLDPGQLFGNFAYITFPESTSLAMQ